MTATPRPSPNRPAAMRRRAPSGLWPLLALWPCLALMPTGALATDEAPPRTVLRDPTLPPEVVRAAASAPQAGASAAAPADISDPARHVMVLGTTPYLVERGWLRGVGDRWGDARIEKITRDAVWLRDASGLRRYPLFPGVQIRPAQGPAGRKAPTESTQ